ncbi:Translin [Xylona heveae TC161]|uniref:Translin n=1 Tax=Xylona heveae (strain CBS 132557 / TC161) TaxID=1328760 RepID=A0A165I124_XYLHT|nr:Translin [Xylona heveae TC161]KZF24205.1 Translin [Xylona heveae TC161]
MMGGTKRDHDGRSRSPPPASPFMPIFETFRNELDEHHDRRERIIKASRDVTAASKKMIFSLQRVKKVRGELPERINKEVQGHFNTIVTTLESISGDLQGINAWRYRRQITGGLQEFIEAATFKHYLETQTLLTVDAAAAAVPGGVQLTEDDYLLGIFDLVGEMMRFAITTMATSGELPGNTADSEDGREISESNILSDLRELRTQFAALDTTTSSGNGLGRDVEKKLEVMNTCVEKVENAVYGLIIRGRERPKGWMPDLGDDSGRGREPVESY